MLKERELAVNNMLAGVDVIIALVTFNLTAYFVGEQATGYHNRDLIILNLLTVAVWFVFSKRFRLGELYRSRPYSIVIFNCAGLSFFGGAILALAAFVLKISFASTWLLGVFIIANMSLTFLVKVIIYKTMKSFRKQGLNSRTVIIKGDKSAIPLIKEMLDHNEWGYRIVAIVGDGLVFKEFASKLPVFSPENINIDELIAQKAIDELIYCKAKPDMGEMETLLYSCSEVGVIFRMYSPFFNMLTNKTHIHYFNTHGLLTFSNTPQDYLSLKAKRLFDFLVSLFVISVFSPLFIVIALIIKTTSTGPVFFKQIRVGLRGRRFWVYKFRTMVTNAEELKHKLMDQNEMDGPVFKITNDPRITGVGNFLRKTSLDELPQFFNVFLGQMSIVGPRPPIPAEVKQYERWQLRRLSMNPGITCIWQISPSRNDISFDDWMRMDLDYIDNWSLKLDFVIILKTVRAIFRADGK
jgi:exopolysaccharide biosynthesis polyprenyl glycosylphosphotransferase